MGESGSGYAFIWKDEEYKLGEEMIDFQKNQSVLDAQLKYFSDDNAALILNNPNVIYRVPITEACVKA